MPRTGSLANTLTIIKCCGYFSPFTCSKLTIETLEQGVKCVLS